MVNSNKIRKILGENIQRIRLQKNLSLNEISIKTKISKEYLKKIENGLAKRVNMHHLFIIAEALSIKPHKLVEKI